MQNIITSGIRTLVPYVVGAVVAWLATKGYHVSDATMASATAFLTFGIGSVYYLVVRSLEHKYPKFGVLLGVPVKPSYEATK